MNSSPNAGWSRVMSYYEPKIFAYLMFLTSILGAVAYPILGWFISKVYFSLLSLTRDPENFTTYWQLLILYFALVILIGFLSGIKKVFYGVAGEHLTHNVRRELLKGIIYK